MGRKMERVTRDRAAKATRPMVLAVEVRAMRVTCSRCQAESWLETHERCYACGALLKRCADCLCYSPERQVCSTLRLVISRHDSEHPTPLGDSANFGSYLPRPRVELR